MIIRSILAGIALSLVSCYSSSEPIGVGFEERQEYLLYEMLQGHKLKPFNRDCIFQVESFICGREQIFLPSVDPENKEDWIALSQSLQAWFEKQPKHKVQELELQFREWRRYWCPYYPPFMKDVFPD